MKLLFLDESGYSRNWMHDIDQQPFYVLAGVCVDADTYADACEDIRGEVDTLNLGLPLPLGQGCEIKARDVASGFGWWRANETTRNRVRDLMLGFPAEYQGSVFVAVIDKARHYDRYPNPHDPVPLALKFVFERVQSYLEQCESYIFCVYDHDRHRTDDLHDDSMFLIREGSQISYSSRFSGERIESTRSLDRILELSLGDSKNSVGLQIADFFATFTYCYFKNRQPTNCGWWNQLNRSLWRQEGRVDGFGLKVFP